MSKQNKLIVFCLSAFLFFYLVLPISATIGPLVKCEPLKNKDGTVMKDENGKIVAENVCTMNDFGVLMKRIADLILGLSGSLALGFFVYGGFVWLTSSGNKERVAKGKAVLISATLGLIIVFTSFMAVEFTIKALTGSNQFDFYGGLTPWQELPAVD